MSKEKEYTFCKETKITTSGLETYYFTRVDGSLVSGSMSTDEEVAKQCFKEILSLKGETAREEVLEIVKS
tara:strand:- start:309 stop:518 length:210 start_codon:yes stop_codon:yes gene_type:complete